MWGNRILLAFLAVAVTGVAAAECVELFAPVGSGPIAFGVGDLERALAERGLEVVRRDFQDEPSSALVFVVGTHDDGTVAGGEVRLGELSLPRGPEAFAVHKLRAGLFNGRRYIVAVGSDPVGAMYGALELAEQLSLSDKASVWASVSETEQSPRIAFRAPNPFLRSQAFIDPDSWYFDEDYWRTYIETLARSRHNWVDFHACFDIETTWFPNVYPYLVESKTFPEVGVSPEEKQRNLEVFNHVIDLAHSHGLKVALMCYQASWRIPGPDGDIVPPYEETAENVATYTAEVVAETIRRCPGLDMIGFRIGESGRAEDFYRDAYIRGIKEAGRPIWLYTRSWGASRPEVMKIFDAYPGECFVEIKYNGEHLGAPYIIAGGRTVGWHSYFYQEYLNYPRNYRVIWQIRANGTHRIFKWGDPDFVRRTVLAGDFCGAWGFCTEPYDAYYPSDDYFHAPDADHDYFTWVHERDWYWYQLWGRLSYNPSLGNDLFVKQFVRRFGPAGGHVYQMVKEMSQVVPLIYRVHCLSADHRGMAPELETGRDVKRFIDQEPFDVTTMCSVREFARALVAGEPDGRMTPLEVASLLEQHGAAALAWGRRASAWLEGNPEFECLRQDAVALDALGRYYASKIRAATLLALAYETGDTSLLAGVKEHLVRAHAAWDDLALVTEAHYREIPDPLRMHTMNYHWKKERERLEEDDKALAVALGEVPEVPGAKAPEVNLYPDPRRPGAPVVTAIEHEHAPGAHAAVISCRAADPQGILEVRLWHKPLPSTKDWTWTPMERKGDLWRAEVEVTPEGLQYFVEAIDRSGVAKRYPDFMVETPYRYIESWEE